MSFKSGFKSRESRSLT